jgi:hypothetical protein
VSLISRAKWDCNRHGRDHSRRGGCRLLPTADGWAAVSCARPDDPPLLAALIGATLPDDRNPYWYSGSRQLNPWNRY